MTFPWTPELEDEICLEIASGKSIREISAHKKMPGEATIYRRLASDKDFAEKMGIARAAQQEFEMDSCIHMADEATPEDWQVVKLRIWARQWRASKLAPKKYGDKVDISAQITGKDGAPLIDLTDLSAASSAYLDLIKGR